jgi:hypothetical protein
LIHYGRRQLEEFAVQAKRIGIAALAALSLIGSTLAMSASAEARSWNRHGGWHHGGWHHGGWHHRGWNRGGFAVGAGLLGGLAFAGAYPYASGRCWIERRPVHDAYGYRHWRRVQICN